MNCIYNILHQLYTVGFSGLFLVNILVSTVVTIYIVMYPAEWIIELMEVCCVIWSTEV